MSDARIQLLGASGAGKSTLLAAIAAAGGVPVVRDAAGNAQVETSTARRRYLLVDAPAGAVPELLGAHVHGAVLVVSGTDGPLPASRSHVQTALSRGVPIVAVYLACGDDLDSELVDLVSIEVSELLTAAGAGSTVPIIRSTGPTPRPAAHGHGHGAAEPTMPGSGVAALAATLDAWMPRP